MRTGRWIAAGAAGLAWTLLVLALAACVLPLIGQLAGAFWDAGPSLAHCRRAFADPARTLLLLQRSLLVAGGGLALALGLGVPLGWLAWRSDLPGRRLLAAGAVFAACLPVALTAGGWIAALGLLVTAGTLLQAALVTGLAYAPLVLLISGVCFAAADPELEDLARLETGRWGVLRHVTLRQGAWGVAGAAFAVLTLSLTSKAITFLLGVSTFADRAFELQDTYLEPWSATATVLPLWLLLFLAGTALFLLLARRGEATLWGSGRPPRPVPLGRARWPLAGAALLAGIVLFLLPLSQFVLLAAGLPGLSGLLKGVAGPDLAGAPARLAANLGEALATTGGEIANTLLIAPLGAALAVAVALVPAWGLARSRRWRWPLGLLVALLLAAPGTVAGIGILRLWNRPGLHFIYDTPVIQVLTYLARLLPFGVLFLLPAVRRLPPELDDLARADGCGFWRRLWQLAVALNWRTLAVAWLFLLVMALGELEASHLVHPPGAYAPLGVRFYTRLHFGVHDAAALGLLTAALAVMPALLLGLVSWRALGRRRDR